MSAHENGKGCPNGQKEDQRVVKPGKSKEEDKTNVIKLGNGSLEYKTRVFMK